MKDNIEDLKLKIETYKELMGDTKKLKWEVKKLESEIIKKDNLIQGMKQIILICRRRNESTRFTTIFKFVY